MPNVTKLLPRRVWRAQLKNTRLVDLARVSGLSTATVSRALRGMSNVRPETTELIKKAAEDLGYEGNDIARSLRTQKTSNLAIIVPSIVNPFFLMLINEVESYVTSQGYNLFLCDSRNDPKNEEVKIRELLRSNVSGILISPSNSEANIDLIFDLSERKRLVQLDRQVTKDGLAWVGFDDTHAMHEIVSHLANQNVKSAAFVTSSTGSSSAWKRQAAVLAAAKKYEIRIPKELIYDGDFSFQWGVESAEKIAKLPVLPDAIICSADIIAIGLMSTLLNLGVRIPSDVLVTGLDDIYLNNYFSPSLTTVRQPLKEIARIAVDNLLNPDTVNQSKEIALPGELIVRESSTRI